MNARLRHRSPHYAIRQRGLTLVEIMVAMAIGLFLLGGLLTIVQNTRKTYGSQNQLAQLQDNERLAMTLLGDVIQAAGYFPDPTTNTVTGALPVVASAYPLGPFPTAGQSITGTTSVALAGDRIIVRFLTAPNDGMINCTGSTNTTAANAMYTNAFRVATVGGISYLTCALNNAAAVPLVSGVQSVKFLYGVKTDFTADNGAVDSYLKASEMTAANWNNVISVKVTLTFANPLAGQPNQPATIAFQRVVSVMNRAGVKT
jgi:type IV pilus assembly protein PilW